MAYSILTRNKSASLRVRKLNMERLEDRSLMAVGLVSVNRTGFDSGNVGAISPTISADGRYVVFQSNSNNLINGIYDANGFAGDIFVRDRQTGQTELVSQSKNGARTGNNTSSNAYISANGRYVVFHSLASDLAPNDHNEDMDIFIRDLQTKTTKIVSLNRNGLTSANADNYITGSPSTPGRFISDNGRYVVFSSEANNLVTGDYNFRRDVFVRDTVSNTTKLVSINRNGTQSGDSNSQHGVISADGRYVAFESNSRNLVTGLTDNVFHLKVFRRDLQTNKTLLASVDKNGKVSEEMDDSFLPQINYDGSVVAFESFGKLTTTDTNTSRDVYVRDFTKTRATLVSINRNGVGANFSSFAPSISDNGRLIAFESIASDLVSNDNDGTDINSKDVFVRDLVAGTTTIVSSNAAGTSTANKESRSATISGNGRFVYFESQATNLISGFVEHNDNLFDFDIFRRDLIGHVTTLVTARKGSTTHTGNDGSRFPFVSRNGRYVTFHSVASDFVTRDTNGGINQTDVFVAPAIFTAPAATHASLPSIRNEQTLHDAAVLSFIDDTERKRKSIISLDLQTTE